MNHPHRLAIPLLILSLAAVLGLYATRDYVLMVPMIVVAFSAGYCTIPAPLRWYRAYGYMALGLISSIVYHLVFYGLIRGIPADIFYKVKWGLLMLACGFAMLTVAVLLENRPRRGY